MKPYLMNALAPVLTALACASRVPPLHAQTEASPAATPAPASVTFDQVLPVLRKRCAACHDRNRERGDLDLSDIEGVKAGGKSGPVVVPGEPDASLVYTLVAHLETPKMPPNGPKIPQREIDLIRRWIEGGLVERGDAAGKSSARPPAALAAEATTTAPVAFDQVLPVLRKHCVICHQADRTQQGSLNLTSIDGVKAGGVSGPAVVSRNPAESLIYTVPAAEGPKIPHHDLKISQREIDLMRRWIEGGLVERSDGATKSPRQAVSNAAKPSGNSLVASATTVTAAVAGVAIEPVPRQTAITALAASPKSPLVAVSGRKQVVLFRWTDRSPLTAFAFPKGDIFALRFSHDGEVLVAGGGVGGLSGRVVGFDVASGKRLFELGDERDVVLAADISPDKSLVALGGPGRSVKVFRVADGTLAATLRKHTDWILSLAFSPDGLLLASGDRFGGLQVWEAESGKEFHTLRGHVGPVTAIAWSADSDSLLSAGQDGSLRFWNMHEGSQIVRWNGGVGGILAAECAASGRVACGGRDRKLTIWEKPEGRLAQMSMPDEVVKLGISHDGSHVIAGDALGNVAVFSLASGELAGNLSLPPGTMISSAPTRPAVASATARSRQQSAGLWDAVVAAEAEARRSASELVEVREALASAESAVKSAEDSLKKLRQTAAKLAGVVSTREAAAKQAAQTAADLRAQAESAESRAEGGPAEMKSQHERMQKRLVEKRSLLDAAMPVTERIERAAAQSPKDASLAAAAKLAVELRSKLAQDVEDTIADLRSLERSSDTAGN